MSSVKERVQGHLPPLLGGTRDDDHLLEEHVNPTPSPETHTAPMPPGDEQSASERVKTSMNMQRSDLEDLRRWADAEGTTMAEIIRRALVVYRYLTDEANGGSKIVLQREGERERELLIKAVR